MPATSQRGVNGPPDKISLKSELWRYDAREPTAGMDPRRRIIRAHVKAIIEQRRKWPVELRAWKERREFLFYHGAGVRVPPWLDERNLTRPQRERALFMDRQHSALVARLRTADNETMRKAAHKALREFYAMETAL